MAFFGTQAPTPSQDMALHGKISALSQESLQLMPAAAEICSGDGIGE